MAVEKKNKKENITLQEALNAVGKHLCRVNELALKWQRRMCYNWPLIGFKKITFSQGCIETGGGDHTIVTHILLKSWNAQFYFYIYIYNTKNCTKICKQLFIDIWERVLLTLYILLAYDWIFWQTKYGSSHTTSTKLCWLLPMTDSGNQMAW